MRPSSSPFGSVTMSAGDPRDIPETAARYSALTGTEPTSEYSSATDSPEILNGSLASKDLKAPLTVSAPDALMADTVLSRASARMSSRTAALFCISWPLIEASRSLRASCMAALQAARLLCGS